MPTYRLSRLLLVIGVVCLFNYLLLTRTYYLFNSSPPSYNYSQCNIPEWNRIETNSVTTTYWNTFSRWLWMKLDLSNENSQNYTAVTLLGAYVYPEYISISISAQYLVKQNMYCRYYDCKKREIPESAWQGVVFPESVVYCPRRIGAEFVSVSKTLEEYEPEPMRLMFRAFDTPVHEFSVCVAPLYGNEPKWLQIAEFVEHHKLEGATFFYFHIGGISTYDRKMLDHYENLGDAEVKVYDDKYERTFYAWQLLEIQDCHLRSKFHSKWTAFIDIDERIASANGRFVDLLPSLDNGKIGEIQLQILNIVKRGDAPEKYVNQEETKRELIFNRYVSSADPTWNASKTVVRSDKVGIMHIHYAVAQESHFGTIRLDSTQSVVRHYRSTQHRIDGADWDKSIQADGKPLKFTDRPLSSEFSAELSRNVLSHVQTVYEKVPVLCSSIPKFMWDSRKFPDPCEKMLLTW